MEIKKEDVLMYDLETLEECFLAVLYIPSIDKWYEFEVSGYKNQLDAFVKFVSDHSEYYWVAYNGLGFDSQVLEWIWRHHTKWIDFSSLEIARNIAQKAQDIIDDRNYGILPQYKEYDLCVKHIDPFTIWHYDNENKRTSLKALEFSMNLEDIEDMPIPWNKKNLTEDDITSISKYCRNDVKALYQHYLITRGETDNPLYKGKDKIADRLTMEEEFGLKCLNLNDVAIGSEWNKLDYIQLTGKTEKQLKPEKIVTFYGKKFKQFFPKTVEFKTPALKQFIKRLGDTHVLNKFQEFHYKFNDELTATIAKGGIHSNEKGRFLKPTEEEIYLQVDIGSQYPNAIRKYKVEPIHLPGWNKLITSKIDRRLKYKALFKETKNPKYASLQEMGKLSLNGGALKNKFGI